MNIGFIDGQTGFYYFTFHDKQSCVYFSNTDVSFFFFNRQFLLGIFM